MKKYIAGLITILAFSALLLAGEGSWSGVVSDDHCGAKHAAASDAAASCVAKCVAGGAKYVLVSEGKVYKLTAQDKFASLAGKSVKVSGTEDAGTITVASVEAAQ